MIKLDDDTTETLCYVLNSFLCGYGEPFEKTFEECPKLKKAYMQLNKKNENVNEATAKSTKDRIRKRHMVPKTYERLKEKTKGVSMVKRVVPKKTQNSDPNRSGSRFYSEMLQHKDIIIFLSKNVTKNGKTLQEAVESFDDKNNLFLLVDHLIATGLGGWSLVENKLINKSGHFANPQNWQLVGDKLQANGASKPNKFDIDWLLEIREYCHE